jgi:hypothetical protein
MIVGNELPSAATVNKRVDADKDNGAIEKLNIFSFILTWSCL